MLEYYKEILGKVSFDPTLFDKEVKKAFQTLMDHEKIALENWIHESRS